MGSRGSVIPFFISQIPNGELTITDTRMTRFMITLEEGVKLVWHAFDDMLGGEIYVKKIPSMKITDIALSVAPNLSQKIIGIRPGEKIHEQMIGFEDAAHTYEYDEHYKILPAIHNWSKDPNRIKKGKIVPSDFTYTSDNNKDWMSKEELSKWIESKKGKIGII
jgi:UDP-N-acetylglucosamine 4,6-dehydratase/5-epimerase